MPYALITGAAKGIGKGIATALARRNYNLLLADIDESGLATAAQEISTQHHVIVHTLPLDLTKPQAGRELISWTTFWHNELTVVVNNAGYGLNGAFEQLELEDQLNIIDLNIKAQVSLSHLYIPVLRNHAQGYLLNVGSTTAFQAVPYLTIYAASKSFVLSFTRGLRFELRHSPVSVSCLIPGSTDTNFVNRANISEATKKTAERFNMSPEEVGLIAVNGLLNRKAEIIPGANNKLHSFFPRFFPKRFVEKIAAGIYGPKEGLLKPAGSLA
jgi:hypothetical protein